MNPATIAKKLARVMMATSRWATWLSSWAMTPSSSSGSSRSSRPWVTATAACLGLRPVANAFGMSVGTIATRGMGSPAVMHSRWMTACSSGASAWLTIFAPDDARAILSLVQYWTTSMPPPIRMIGMSPRLNACARTTKKMT